jgi:hypothetical protein
MIHRSSAALPEQLQGRSAAEGKLDGIADEIRQDLAQMGRVAAQLLWEVSEHFERQRDTMLLGA